MSGKPKRGGRVTAKGTKPPEKKRVEQKDQPDAPDTFTDNLPGKVQRKQQRVARPISHNRGNR